MWTKLMSMLTAIPKARVARQLRKTGLLAEDLFVEYSDYQEALLRLPADVLEKRDRRIRRAFDLSLKHEEMPLHLQNYDPFESYLGSELKKARQKRTELEIIDRA